MDAKQTRQGVLLALAAYFIWGIAPAYFKLIYYVPADEILTHRVIWSFFFMVVLMSICRQWSYLNLGGEQSPYAGSEPWLLY